ncbi:hypothetical protein [Paludibacterium yongneupense]|uniref:hypothetical protein n=1 Tax=Paludibacterium yongneupense TaxID=400061 RepID=UPI000400EEBC|nr:hypothetical protein [Paludibacterium yongneupense]
MFSIIILAVLAGVLHLFLHLPVVLALIVAAVLWLVWKLKYVILAFIGVEWLLDRDR